MIVLGLTGSIGMGKSTTAQMFMDEGIPVYDADAAVHKLYRTGGIASEKIGTLFQDVVDLKGNIDRQKLGKIVLNDDKAMKQLESIVHPLVQADREEFLKRQDAKKELLVVFDIPLLFETGGEGLVDRILVVTAPPDIQKQRVLARDSMTFEKFEAILEKQLPDEQKRQKADFIIDTSLGLDHARQSVQEIISVLLAESQTTKDS